MDRMDRMDRVEGTKRRTGMTVLAGAWYIGLNEELSDAEKMAGLAGGRS